MNWKHWTLFIFLDLVIITAAGLYYFAVYLAQPPADFTPQTFTIDQGESLKTVTKRLAQQNIIRSSLTTEAFFILTDNTTNVKAGTYQLDTPLSSRAVVDLLVTGQFDTDLLTLTFVEGERVDAYGAVAAEQLPDFDLDVWNELTAETEGLLFPDTYKVPPDFTAQDLFDLLRDQHNAELAALGDAVSTSDLSASDIVILASIIEREANTETSMRTVAGIFLNRLDIGMPLQADASIEYVLDTPLGELPPGQLAADLRDIDSPYNTYLYGGLPPTPIGNPGRVALAAVVNPIDSDYLYYITGNDGEFYYAQTYNQHLLNIERHLR